MKVKYLSLRNLDKIYIEMITAGNISCPSAAVVFGGHLSAQASFRVDRKSPVVRPPLRVASYVGGKHRGLCKFEYFANKEIKLKINDHFFIINML